MVLREENRSWAVPAAYTLALGFGLMAAVVDVAVPFGDDTAKATLFLWLVSSSLVGFFQPRRPWRWALLIGPWVPAAHLFFHVLRWGVPFKPDTTTILVLIPVSLAACLIAAYSGSLLRRLAGLA